MRFYDQMPVMLFCLLLLSCNYSSEASTSQKSDTKIKTEQKPYSPVSSCDESDKPKISKPKTRDLASQIITPKIIDMSGADSAVFSENSFKPVKSTKKAKLKYDKYRYVNALSDYQCIHISSNRSGVTAVQNAKHTSDKKNGMINYFDSNLKNRFTIKTEYYDKYNSHISNGVFVNSKGEVFSSISFSGELNLKDLSLENPFVTAEVNGELTYLPNHAIVLTKRNPDGSLVWFEILKNKPFPKYVGRNSSAFREDSSGQAHLVIATDEPITYKQQELDGKYLLLSFNNEGEIVRVIKLDPAIVNKVERSISHCKLQIDSNNNFVIACSVRPPNSMISSAFLIKMTMAGKMLWQRTLPFLITDLAVDNSNSIYLSRSKIFEEQNGSNSAPTRQNHIVVFSSKGVLSRSFTAAQNKVFSLSEISIAVDDEQNIYAAGSFNQKPNMRIGNHTLEHEIKDKSKFFMAKFNNKGNLTAYNFIDSRYSYNSGSIAIDAMKRVWVCTERGLAIFQSRQNE